MDVLDIDSELIFVRLVFEEKNKISKEKTFYSTDNRTPYEAPSEAIEYQ